MKAAATLPRLLDRNAASFPDRVAWREKRGGIWQETTWSDYAALVSRFAGGLAAQGFGRGDRLAVIGDNRPRLYAALLAAQSLGGVGVPLWPDADPDRIARILGAVGVSVVVAEDAEQVEKIVAIKDGLPALRLVVQTTTHGMRPADHAWLKPFEAIADPGASSIEQSEPDDVALLLYSRTESGESLAHSDLIAAAEALVAAEDVKQTDEAVAWLPMAWFDDVLMSQALALSVGFTCNCPETPETARGDLREIGPTILIAPPRVWESTLADIEARAAQASRLKRALFARFRAAAERIHRLDHTAGRIPLTLRLKVAIGEALVFVPMRDQIGLRRLRWANTAGEPLAANILNTLHAFGIDLKQSHHAREPADPAWEPAHA
jgi:long-chain acyl-CoA synthetase